MSQDSVTLEKPSLNTDEIVREALKNATEKKEKSPSRLSIYWNQLKVKTKKNKIISACLFVIFLFSFYQIIIASPRFESRAQVIVQQPDAMATMDTSMAFLSGLGVSAGYSDAELIKIYIHSNDMLSHLNERLNLKAHYTSTDVDYFSRLSSASTLEEFSEFYKTHIDVSIDEKSKVITVLAQGFDAEFAHQLVSEIVKQAEWYVNSIGHQLAESQLDFIKNEHSIVENKLSDIQIALLQFQQKYNLLDPTAEGMAHQQIAYELESQLSKNQAKVSALRNVLNDNSPQMTALKDEINALNEQLDKQRDKLTNSDGTKNSISEILAKYTDYKVKLELAIKGYTSSQISLEKARIEAYKQLKYLVVVEKPTTPESHQYPAVLYNILLFSVLLMGTVLIVRIIVSVVNELR